METIASWILAAMVALAPPGKLASRHTYGGHIETEAQRLTRYESIAHDIAAEASRNPFAGSADRTAALLTAVAWGESGFAPDADLGPCGGGRCDGGRSACMLQIQVGNGLTREGFSRGDLFADRTKCLSVGARMMATSLRGCASLPESERLAAYASGSCRVGRAASRERWRLFERVLSFRPSRTSPGAEQHPRQ